MTQKTWILKSPVFSSSKMMMVGTAVLIDHQISRKLRLPRWSNLVLKTKITLQNQPEPSAKKSLMKWSLCSTTKSAPSKKCNLHTIKKKKNQIKFINQRRKKYKTIINKDKKLMMKKTKSWVLKFKIYKIN